MLVKCLRIDDYIPMLSAQINLYGLDQWDTIFADSSVPYTWIFYLQDALSM